MHEESIRVPMLVFEPRLPANARGRTCDEMVLNIDLAPTILDLAGLVPPQRMQGKSLVPLLTRADLPFREDWFYEHHVRTRGLPIERSEGVRARRWKYIRYIDQKPNYEQLFDLEADPRETRNLAEISSHRATLDGLRARWRAYSESLI
jgi:arylsulfatase A-like enzyme